MGKWSKWTSVSKNKIPDSILPASKAMYTFWFSDYVTEGLTSITLLAVFGSGDWDKTAKRYQKEYYREKITIRYNFAYEDLGWGTTRIYLVNQSAKCQKLKPYTTEVDTTSPETEPAWTIDPQSDYNTDGISISWSLDMSSILNANLPRGCEFRVVKLSGYSVSPTGIKVRTYVSDIIYHAVGHVSSKLNDSRVFYENNGAIWEYACSGGASDASGDYYTTRAFLTSLTGYKELAQPSLIETESGIYYILCKADKDIVAVPVTDVETPQFGGAISVISAASNPVAFYEPTLGAAWCIAWKDNAIWATASTDMTSWSQPVLLAPIKSGSRDLSVQIPEQTVAVLVTDTGAVSIVWFDLNKNPQKVDVSATLSDVVF